MKPILLNYSDDTGGAARAAFRIHRALLRAGTDSRMRVVRSGTDDPTVATLNCFHSALAVCCPLIGGLIKRFLITENPILHSPALLSSGCAKNINASDADLVHLHWVNNEMLSIVDIGRICKPVVWTIHDMWPFCGAEHYTEDYRWRDGYTTENRPAHERGIDLNRWTWKRKRKAWRKSISIVAPSSWLADSVRQSALMCDWPVTVIPNTIDTDVWKPVNKDVARQKLKLPPESPLLLFGAFDGTNDPRKGFDLLSEALNLLSGQIDDLQLLIFGQSTPFASDDLNFPVHCFGRLNDDLTLQTLYSAADGFVIPSRQEAFGLTALEANACGTPAIGFSGTGVADIISHKRNGYLARAFDAEDLARGIQWVLSDEKRYAELSLTARQDTVDRFSYPVVAEQYCRLFEAVLGGI